MHEFPHSVYQRDDVSDHGYVPSLFAACEYPAETVFLQCNFQYAKADVSFLGGPAMEEECRSVDRSILGV